MATKSIAWTTGQGSVTLTYTGQGNGTIQVTSDQNNLYEARSMQITVMTTQGGNVSKSVTISQAAKVRTDISNAVVTATNQTYSGFALTPTPTVILNGSTVPLSGYDVAYSNNTNAGTATITVTGKNDYTGTATGTFTINKVTPTVVAPTAKVLTYNETAQALVNAGSTDFGTLKYSLDNSTWSTSIPTATNQGSYTVYYKVEGDSNVNSISSSSVACSINEKQVTATVILGETSYTYDGNAKQPSVTVKDGTTIIPSSEYSVSYSNNTNAGTATVTISDNAGGNYEVIGSATFTIAKAAGSVSINGVSLTYNGDARSLATVSGNTGTMHYSTDYSSWNTSVPTGTNASSYTVYWYMDASTNYEGISASSSRYVSSSIAKADQSAPTAYGATTTYPNTATASASGGGGVGSIEWSNGDTQTSVGSKTTYARWTGNSNYNASAWSNGVELVMNKAAGSVSISGVSSSYSGGLQSLASVSGATGTMHYSTDYSNWSTSIPASTNAGSWTIYWYMDASTNYEGIGASTSRYVSSSIAKINPTITAYPTNANPTYTGSAQYLLTGGSANISGSFSYSTGTDAGSYTATWWFTPSDTTNYNSLSGNVSATISKASGSVYATANSWTYDGTAHSVVYNAGGYGTLQYQLYGGSWTTSVPTATDAGAYQCRVYSPGDANHNEAYSDWYTCSVGKAGQSAPTAYGASTTYPTVATATASGGGGAGSIEWYNGSSRSTAGSQTTKARWTGNSNYYASDWSNEVTLSVEKANPSISAPTAKTGLTYTGSEQTLYNAGSNSTPGSFSYTNGTRTNAGSQTVSWSFTPSDTTNYNGSSGAFDVTIAKANRTVSFSSPTTSVDVGSTVTNVATVSAGASDGTLTYTSSNTSYATVNSSGVVTGVAAGSVTITASITGGTNYNDASSSYSLTVAQVIPTVQDFNYTGSAQSVALPAGSYFLECWGAKGGGTDGGKGGYSVGTLTLSATTNVYIYVGGGGIYGSTVGEHNGGFNGGGNCYSSSSKYREGSGGGASDIRIGTDSLYARVIVAGGGGGTGMYSSTTYSGGAGGGTSGITPSSYRSGYNPGGGGTQTSGGDYGNSTAQRGSFGQGGGMHPSYTKQTAGGGGGWYGGGSAIASPGGGGSGYAYTADTASDYPSGCLLNSNYYLSDAETIDGDHSFPAPAGGTETGHYDDGHVRITRLS